MPWSGDEEVDLLGLDGADSSSTISWDAEEGRGRGTITPSMVRQVGLDESSEVEEGGIDLLPGASDLLDFPWDPSVEEGFDSVSDESFSSEEWEGGFMTGYVPPAPPGGVGGLLAQAAQAAENARFPSRPLLVPDLLAMMRAERWGKTEPPMRPLWMVDSEAQRVFREPRNLSRRQKLRIGMVDRWKNSGGKSAKVKLEIPHALRHDEANVLVARHGRVLLCSGLQMRYRQWSYGMELPDGTVREDQLQVCSDVILYQVFTEKQQKAGAVAPLDPVMAERRRRSRLARMKRKEEKKKKKKKRKKEEEEAASRSSCADRQDGGVVASAQTGPTEVDWGTLPRSTIRRQMESVDLERPSTRRRTSAISICLAAAVLGLLAYRHGDGTHSMIPQADDADRYSAGNISHQDPYTNASDQVSYNRPLWLSFPQCPRQHNSDATQRCEEAVLNVPRNLSETVPSALAPPPPGHAWTPLFRQTHPFYQRADRWLNYNAAGYPDEDNFSVLDNLESCRGSVVDGKFDLKIVWPHSVRVEGNSNVWRQRSNPVTTESGGVDEYEAISIALDPIGADYAVFSGLHSTLNAESLLDGSLDSHWWLYSVGASHAFHGGIAGPSMVNGEPETELWAVCPTAFTPAELPQIAETPSPDLAPPPPGHAWTPLFRQTHPFYQPADRWLNYNAAGYPDEDNFSVLDNLESCRGSVVDGKFDLKIVWPHSVRVEGNSNVWRQRSNPVTTEGGGVDGYEAISISFNSYGVRAGDGFGGLEFNSNAESLLDGSVDHEYWFYAVGAAVPFYDGLPGGHSDYSETQNELWAVCPTVFVPVPTVGAVLHTGEPAAHHPDIGLVPPPPGHAWTPLFRQTHPFYQPADRWLNYNAAGYPDEDNFSVLDNLESCRGSVVDGKFDLKIVWPHSVRVEGNSNVWRQRSNPVTTEGGGVDGYEAISISFNSYGIGAGDGFGGLEFNSGIDSLLDGSVDHEYWFYAIGTSHVFIMGGIPGAHVEYGEDQAELWAVCPTPFQPVALSPEITPVVLAPPPPGHAWTPLFRQTHPFYQPADRWLNYNAAGYPDEDNFSVLDNLESCRGSVVDGKFDLKIVWPHSVRVEGNSNVWRQRSNPVTTESGGVDGYEAISISIDAIVWSLSAGRVDSPFGGLGLNSNAESLLDGCPDNDLWYNAIGTSVAHRGGIPGAHVDHGEKQSELWAVCPIPFVPVATVAASPAPRPQGQ